MSPYIEGCLANIVLTNLKIVENKVHTLSCMSIRSFLFSMSVFLYTTNRMNMSYGDIMDITKAEKRLHTFKVLCEWPSAREQLKLENMYNSELGIHLGQKLGIFNRIIHPFPTLFGQQSGLNRKRNATIS